MNEIASSSDLFSAEKAAEYLGISKVTFYKKKAKFKIKTRFHIEKSGYYRREDLDNMKEKMAKK